MSVYAFTAAIKAGGKDASVVEDHQVAGLKQVREIAELAIPVVTADPLYVQHARVIACCERLLGNQFVGKMKMEI